MKNQESSKKRILVFKPDGFTEKEIRESSLADLLFCATLRDLQASLEPSKFRPAGKSESRKK